MTAADRTWRVGELARMTGLSVRALHHYDERGLLVPPRGEGGHRRYGRAEVERLYRILALRSLDLSLDQVEACLEAGGGDVRSVMVRQLAALDRRLEVESELRRRLAGVLEALERLDRPSMEALITTIEGMSMIDKHYTPEQVATLERRRQAMGDEAVREAEGEWADLIAEVERARRAGTDPRDPRVQELAARARALIDAFTGGDEGVRSSLERMYEEEGASAASRGAVSSELMDYMRRAHEVATTR